LGVITRLRNPLLASLRDSPKPRPDLRLVIPGFGYGIGIVPLATVEGPQGFTGNGVWGCGCIGVKNHCHCEKRRLMRSDAAILWYAIM